MNGGNLATLEDCLDALIDYRGKTPKKTDSGIPLITAKIVKSGRIETPNEFIAEEDYEPWMTRGYPELGDVVLTTEAPLGEVGQINFLPIALAQRIVTLRGKKGILDNDYLLYLLQTEEMQSQLVGRASGTTVIGIKQSELRKAEVRLPSVSEQREVASTLKALDDRIDNLRQTNAMLEAIAAALFKSWFVDFDGIAPEDMQESELGLIPKGWRVGGLEELLVLQRGFDLPVQNRIEGEYPVIAAGGINGTHHEAMVKGPGVVTGRSGVLGNVFLALGDFWPLNTTLWIKEFRAATPCFAYELLRRFDFGVFNAGSAVPTLNRNHVHGLPQFIPPPEKVVKFEDIAISLHQRAAQNSRQAATLTTLRDSLLPRLISGQLRVGKAEGLLDNAAHPRSAP